MNFCDVCDNMLYVNIDENEVLTYKCKTCQKVYDHKINKTNCVYEETYNIDDIRKETLLINIRLMILFLKAKGVKCPNDTCPSKKPILYI